MREEHLKGRGKPAAWLAIATAAVVLASACGGGGANGSGSNAPYKIGVIESVTGGGAQFGQNMKDAFDAWKATALPDGKINGHPVQFIVVDDQTSPDLAVQQARNLITQEKVIALVGTTEGNVYQPVAPLTDQHKTMLMTSVGKYSDKVNFGHWVYSALLDHTVAATTMLDFAKSKGWHSVGFSTSDDAFGKAMDEDFTSRFDKGGWRVTDKEIIGYTSPDSTPQMLRLKNSNPDGVILYGAGPGSVTAWKNLKQVGFNRSIIVSPAYQDIKVVQAVGASADGAYILTDGIESCPVPRQKQAIAALQSHGVTSIGFAHYADWTLLSLTKAALERANLSGDPAKVTAERQKLRDVMEQTKNFPGASGVITYGPDNHTGISSNAFIWGQFNGTTVQPLGGCGPNGPATLGSSS